MPHDDLEIHLIQHLEKVVMLLLLLLHRTFWAMQPPGRLSATLGCTPCMKLHSMACPWWPFPSTLNRCGTRIISLQDIASPRLSHCRPC
jgi:hypothetical protein